MKLWEREVDELHLLALYAFRARPAMLRRINSRYRQHVNYLVRAIRRASKKGVKR